MKYLGAIQLYRKIESNIFLFLIIEQKTYNGMFPNIQKTSCSLKKLGWHTVIYLCTLIL